MAKLNKILIILFAFLLIGFSARPVFALDESGEYPSLMWGPTTVIENPGTSWQMIFYSQTE
ncbi:MAG: hypothetical protein NTY30_03070, partial [Candidatus Berkelbacteria bacterium]|nr:hypothetical protein [Candidatus Berkelbacteria bacterium]